MERRQQLGTKVQRFRTLPIPPVEINKTAVKPGPKAKGPSENRILLRTMYGIGDTLFQVPLIKEIARHYENVWVHTIFPEALWEMPQNVHLIPTSCAIRTQRKYIAARQSKDWYEPKLFSNAQCPGGTKKVGLRYKARDIIDKDYTVFDSFMHHMRLADVKFDEGRPLDFSLSIRQPWADAARRLRRRIGLVGKFAIVRSVTYRKECMFLQRNCDHDHLQTAVDHLNLRGIPVIEVADVDGKMEFFVKDKLQNIHTHFIRGEIDLPVLMALVDQATVTVTPTGMMYHIGQILRSQMVVLFGGMHSNKYFEHPSFSTPSVRCILPEPFCNCWLSNCNSCNKYIPKEIICSAIDEKL